MRAPEGKGGREQGTEKLFEEIMIENVPNLLKERVAQAQEAQSPKQGEPKEARTEARHNENPKG